MAGTFTQLSVQAIFAVQGRQNMIRPHWRDELHRYISGILNEYDAKSLAVGGWSDHVHIFFGLPPAMAISKIIQIVKANSSKWINDNDFLRSKFNWQEGYGAFSYSKSQRNRVIKYIMNQETHHKIRTFREEYLDILKKADVKYDEKYLFEFYD